MIGGGHRGSNGRHRGRGRRGEEGHHRGSSMMMEVMLLRMQLLRVLLKVRMQSLGHCMECIHSMHSSHGGIHGIDPIHGPNRWRNHHKVMWRSALNRNHMRRHRKWRQRMTVKLIVMRQHMRCKGSLQVIARRCYHRCIHIRITPRHCTHCTGSS